MWQSTNYEARGDGTVVPHVHKYTELASGLYYRSNGVWTESKELIEGYAGGAIARQGPYQVIFANNLNSTGATDQQTPEGKRLRSNILGLAYYDSASGQRVMIAQIQDSQGELLSSNQVLYPNAFSGVNADVRYTYKKASFEQDVILREQPPTPEALGLSSQTTEIEVLTEFINPPEATISEHPSKNSLLPDDDIAWGATRISHGKAFDLGESADKARQVRVRRQYETLDGRKILIEGVPVTEIQPDLSHLPLQSSLRLKNPPVLAVKTWTLPKTPLGRSRQKPMSLAAANVLSKGYVLDYVEINTGQGDYTFQGDATYYVSGYVYCSGNVVLEGGTVLKFPDDDSGCVDGVITCESGPYRPGVLTSMDDDSVGEAISGSSGSPAVNGCTYLLFESFTLESGLALNNVRISYAGTGAADDNEADWVGVSDSQFVDCTEALSTEADTIALNNDLLSNCGTVVSIFNAGEIDLTQVTADQIGLFINDPKGNGGCVMTLTNSILSNVSDMMSYDDNLTFMDTADVSLVNSVLTGSPGNVDVVSSQNSYQPADASGLYQSVGGGSYYLATGSPYRGAGTNDIDAGVLADIATKTTYPPTVYSGTTITAPTTYSPQAARDNSATPDLGYHYDPLDYVFGGVDDYSNLTFTAGTAVGWFNDDGGYGLSLNGTAAASFNGTATVPCVLASANVVQEGGNGVWTAETDWGGFIGLGGNDTEDTAPAVNLDFTRCYARSSEGNYFTDSGDGTVLAVSAANTEFYDGAGAGDYLFLDLVNCLAVRATLGADSVGPAAVTLETCTFYGGSLTAVRESLDGGSGDISQWPVFVENCAFAGTDIEPLINRSGGGTNVTWWDYNSYLITDTPPEFQGPASTTVSAYNWESSWFGDHYLPANSPLRRSGSTTSDQLGLYHFTTQTNQAPETNAIVDIGYHYIATDASGNPLDTDGDGIPDYLADANGNGLDDTNEVPWDVAIFTQPLSQFVNPGATATFTVTAAGNPPLGYQWKFNGTNLAGATASTYSVVNASVTNAGIYSVAVTSLTGCTLTSSNASLSVGSQLGYWRFDITNQMAANAWIGDEGQLPLTATNVAGVPSWDTNAVLIDSTNAAILGYRVVETNGNVNVSLSAGTVSVWFRPAWSSLNSFGVGPGGSARLIEIGEYNPVLNTNTDLIYFTNGWWSIYLTPDGNHLVFGCSTNGGFQINFDAAITFTSNQWCQVVLTYTPTNSLLYLNSVLLTNGLGPVFYPNQSEQAAGFRIGSDFSGNNQAHGVFEDLATFNFPMDAGTIAANFQAALALDSDGDGLSNILENELGLNPYGYNSLYGLSSTNGLETFTPLR